MIPALILIFYTCISVEYWCKPRLDWTEYDELILWFNWEGKRDYIKLTNR